MKARILQFFSDNGATIIKSREASNKAGVYLYSKNTVSGGVFIAYDEYEEKEYLTSLITNAIV